MISVILVIGLIFFFGYIGGMLATSVGLPRVSGFVLVGIVLSPAVTGVISGEFLRHATVVVDFALAMVAYSLGGRLTLRNIKGHGNLICLVTLGEGLAAYVFVSVGTVLYMLNGYPAFTPLDVAALALLLGATSISTAPAATVATIHEYRARGGFTSTVLIVVALDDAMGLIVFALSASFVGKFILGGESSLRSVLEPFTSILVSTALGVFAGLVLVWMLKRIRKKDTLVIVTVALFCLAFGSAQQLGLEPLLATMAMGMAVANIYPGDIPFKFIEENYETMVLAMFFVLAGAHIDIRILADYLPLAALFVILRLAGKWVGAYLGGVVSGAERRHSLYMGLALAPQAGIAIGLALYLERTPIFEQYGAIAINVILASTAINEVIGPWLLKIALSGVRETGKA